MAINKFVGTLCCAIVIAASSTCMAGVANYAYSPYATNFLSPAATVYHTAPAAYTAPVVRTYTATAPAAVSEVAPVVNTYSAVPAISTIEVESSPRYDFSYGVHDSLTGDIKSQVESRDGGNVAGSYSVVDADGYRRTVTYTADDINGFNAVVQRDPIVTRAAAVVAPVAAPVTSVTPFAAAVPAATHVAAAVPVTTNVAAVVPTTTHVSAAVPAVTSVSAAQSAETPVVAAVPSAPALQQQVQYLPTPPATQTVQQNINAESETLLAPQQPVNEPTLVDYNLQQPIYPQGQNFLPSPQYEQNSAVVDSSGQPNNDDSDVLEARSVNSSNGNEEADSSSSTPVNEQNTINNNN